jgi:excinuclease ABC subunit B
VAEEKAAYAAEIVNLTPAALARKIEQLEAQMLEHAKNLEFEEAAQLRDQLSEFKQAAFVG